MCEACLHKLSILRLVRITRDIQLATRQGVTVPAARCWFNK